MADEIDISRPDLSRHEQIDLLGSSVGQWNVWRKRHDVKEPVLGMADLRNADLRGGGPDWGGPEWRELD